MKKLSYKLLIVDDKPETLVYLKMLLDDIPFINKDIEVITNAVDAIQYLKENEVDILLLDMELGSGEISGIRLSMMIANPPVMAACSAHPEYVFEAEDTSICAYFSKKISFNALQVKMEELVERVDRKLENQSRDIKHLLMTNLEGKVIELPLADIYYAIIDNNTLTVYLESEQYQFNEHLNSFQSRLPAHSFARPRNNTLVHLAKVDLVRTNEFYLCKPRNIDPLSMTADFKGNFKHQFEIYKQNNK
ncbi:MULTISPECIES: LytTR family DNA-binding domain-containing protein [unclassified Sphingobacterium]|uniref:LytR/AlgR family response regulator transcription factor n=1 Tax=unclassified Sphingobacterium TaxID=2609468 RepID=UPI00104F96B5|nr:MULTISPECIES: LytTR family DNA-binding domain-containing protein [unclassified Sphingobacterium]MCS3556800.1 DNA-binding LytR/AlgR family response regulator [Sphingobacterium sp. JUb21]TCQ99274.1 LytTR family two component transcriptional regulator [Sphingobacterium sp. JUb20]